MMRPNEPVRRYGENWDDFQDRLGSYHEQRKEYEKYWEEREQYNEDSALWEEVDN